jgi:hypothetical protein
VSNAERRLTDEEVSAVFRRAAELDDAGELETTALDRTAIERAAVEAGLSLEAIRGALAELDSGRLSLGQTTRRQLWPDRRVMVERKVPVGEAVAGERIRAFLRGQTMRVTRRRAGVTVWEPAEGVAARVVRGVDLAGRMQLKYVSRVTVSVVGDAVASHIRIELDFARLHSNNLGGAVTGAGIGAVVAAGSVVAAVVASDASLLAIPIAGAVSATTWFGTRSSYRARVDKAVAAVELVLDVLEEPT